MILYDATQLAVAGYFAATKDAPEPPTVEVLERVLLRYISDIKEGIAKQSKDNPPHPVLDQMGVDVICFDGRDSWRKSIFAHYKIKRSKTKKASDFDWTMFYDSLRTLRTKLRQDRDLVVLWDEKLEADDIIAWQVREQRDVSHITIVSSDKDFFQLQKYDNVRQYCPRKKEFISPNMEPKSWLFEHIVKGDSSDGIPNIFTREDVYTIEGARSSPVTPKRLESARKRFWEDFSDDEKSRYELNEDLIDLSKTPQELLSELRVSYMEQIQLHYRPQQNIVG